MQHLSPRRVGFAAPGQQRADHQSRNLEQHQEHHRIAVHNFAQSDDVGRARGESHDADRAVVRGDGTCVGDWQLADAAQDRESQQRDQ